MPPEWFDYFGGLADKIEGPVIPIDKPEMFNFTKHEPLGRRRLHRAVEFANPAAVVEARRRASRRQHRCDQAIRIRLRVHIEFGCSRRQVSPKASSISYGFFWLRQRGRRAAGGARLCARSRSRAENRRPERSTRPAAKHFKGVTLELGGKSPNIVFADAQFSDNAVKGAISGIFAARGRPAIAGSRLSGAEIDRTRVHAAAHRVCRNSENGRSEEAGDAGRSNHNPAAIPESSQLTSTSPARKAPRLLGASNPTIPRSSRAGLCSRRSSAKSAIRCASRRKKYSVPCCRLFHLPTKTRRSRSATISPMGLGRRLDQ